MNNYSEPLNVQSYRGILFRNDLEDPYKTADTQRKCLVQMYKASCKSMDNASVCELLAHRLEKYNKTVIMDGQNIYNELLKQTNPDLKARQRLRVPKNLDKIDLNSYIKDLKCPNRGKFYCSQSEKPTQAELQKFKQLLNTQNPKKENQLPHKSVFQSEEMETLRSLSKNQENRFYKKSAPINSFKTAGDELETQALNKFGRTGSSCAEEGTSGGQKKKLGMRRNIRSKFVSPLLSKTESNEEIDAKTETPLDERIKNIEPKMVERIRAEIMDQGPGIGWNDIAGLEFAKSAIQEAVVWPMLRPDIFTGLRKPPKGILLFGPPGTGKTLIGKCVASQSKSTFFSISASSLTSKWVGDGEKMVRALFAVARVHQPAVIFIDEVDSLLTQRSDTEHESSRRIKTEFLVQLDGAATDSEERLLVIGATNRPQELDEAARRRFVKRLYIPLPEYEARLELVKQLISNERHLINEDNFKKIATHSEGYSGADIKNLCSEASLGPIRSIDFSAIENIQASEVRPLTMEDFEKSLRTVRPSVSQNDLTHYINWDKTYGSGSGS